MTVFTCPTCGRRTTDITRPCPHWWNLLWRRLTCVEREASAVSSDGRWRWEREWKRWRDFG
jgi:hypothetical protein